MSRKGENIYKRKDGRWEGRYIKGYSSDGKTQYGSVYGKSYREVRVRLLPLKACPPVMHENRRDMLFAEAARQWFGSKEGVLKQSSMNKYHNLLKSYILPQLEDMVVSDITVLQIEQLIAELLSDNGRNLQKKTVSDVLGVIRSVLKYAAIQGAAPSCTGKELRIPVEQKPLRVLSEEEQVCLLDFLGRDGSMKALGIILCLFTGIRLGELCALQWQDFSWQEGTVYIHQTMQRVQVRNEAQKTSVLITPPKSSCSIRKIPLPKELLLLLQPKASQEGFFLTGKVDRYVEPREMEAYFQKITRRCKLEQVHFHTLRHTFATRCIELGFDVKTLSEILGHSSITITMNRYVHPSMQLKREHMQKLSKLLAVK